MEGVLNNQFFPGLIDQNSIPEASATVNFCIYVETVDCRNASRFLVREIFSSASDAFSRTPRTISSGAFSTNYSMEEVH